MAIDEAGLEAFVEKVAGDLGAALHASTVVIGDRLGLYRALADLGPTDPAGLASATGTDIRLVREWLDAQYVSGYCHFSARTATYWLSPEQAAVLADPAGSMFLVRRLARSAPGSAAPGTPRPTPSSKPGRRPHHEQETNMAGIEINDFSAPDDVRRPGKTTVEVVKLAGGEIGRYTFQPGWRWSEHIKPVVGTESCQTEHIGYVVAGTLGVRSDDGTSGEATAGSVYRIAPGHDGWVVGDQPVVVVEFQGAATYAK